MKKLSFVLSIAVAMLLISNPAFAEGASAAHDNGRGWIGLAAGLAIALAVVFSCLGSPWLSPGCM